MADSDDRRIHDLTHQLFTGAQTLLRYVPVCLVVVVSGCGGSGGMPDAQTDGARCVPAAETQAEDTCADGADNDCDGFIDLDDSSCAPCPNAVAENTIELCTDQLDNDCNGFADFDDAACMAVCPGYMLEDTLALCMDALDNDCDTFTDDDDPGCADL